jgi:hypothetical protein
VNKTKGDLLMNITYVFIAVVLIVVIMGVILGLIFAARGKSSERLHDQFGAEYDRTVVTLGSEKKAQTELNERQEHVKALNIRPLSVTEQKRYQADWASVQAKFVDEPGEAVVDADGLIMEVMQLRNYPMSDFEQRAADVSVSYPSLASNYRAARVIAVENEKHLADTEELRQAMIYYRSLFEELLGMESVAA